MEPSIIAVLILLAVVDLYQLNCLLMALSNTWYLKRRLLLQAMHASSVGPMRSRKFMLVAQPWTLCRFWIRPGHTLAWWSNFLNGTVIQNGRITFERGCILVTYHVTDSVATVRKCRSVLEVDSCKHMVPGYKFIFAATNPDSCKPSLNSHRQIPMWTNLQSSNQIT